MTQFDRSLRSRFFLTAPRPCPYLPGRRERKLFTHLSGPSAGELHDELTGQGFRRSQTIAYRPACEACDACLSTRVPVADFRPSRSQKRAVSRNLDLRRASRPPEATDEHFALFRRYLNERHADGGMTDMDAHDFASMIEDTPVRTRIVEYRTGAEDPDGPGRLVAACVTDFLGDGLSLVYSYFCPDERRRSLGAFIILDHIALARTASLPYVYLGYWVKNSPKMDYKKSFHPSEILTEHGWIRDESREPE